MGGMAQQAPSPGGKGGAMPAPGAAPGAAAPAGMQQAQAPNMYQTAASGINQGMGATQAAMAGPNIGQFMNPYQQNVMNNSMQNLERQRLMAQNNTDAQAGAAGAFGGSRHGIANAATNEAFARQGAQMWDQQAQQGFNTALGAAQNQQSMMMNGGNQLAALGNMGFNQAQQINQQQLAQGMMQQGVQQQLIDAARAQFGGFANAPNASLQMPINAVSAGNMGQGTSTQTRTPGLFDYLSLGASMISDIRLKKNVVFQEQVDGVRFYTWDWTEEGQKLASGAPSKGVIAQELAEVKPHLVKRGDDGFLRVNYKGLMVEMMKAA